VQFGSRDEQKLDQKLDHRAFEYHSPTGPSPWIKFSVPTRAKPLVNSVGLGFEERQASEGGNVNAILHGRQAASLHVFAFCAGRVRKVLN